MIGYICSAITDFVVTFADDSDIVNLHGWSQGSFSGMSWGNIKVAVVVVGIAAVCTFLLSKPISAYQLGEAYAQSMGVSCPWYYQRGGQHSHSENNLAKQIHKRNGRKTSFVGR